MEGIRLANPAKAAVANHAASVADIAVAATDWNNQENNNGTVATSKYVEKIHIDNPTGTITITFNSSTVGININENELVFVPSVHSDIGILDLETAMINGKSGSFDWGCSSATNTTATSRNLNISTPLKPIQAKYVPAECR
ncbi:pilin [Thiothrix winogradskyi]|uniref:Pilin n=2 Tax=Thiothrix winogradskyi TaxID=96472 RepID=A0ABY3T9F5_9GAMM|nr:pilin [Thiothrix winogradskyi]